MARFCMELIFASLKIPTAPIVDKIANIEPRVLCSTWTTNLFSVKFFHKLMSLLKCFLEIK